MTIPLVLLILIAINALYVAGEFAAVSTRSSRIRQLADEGNAQARWMAPIVEDRRQLDRYVAACQIGITLSSILVGAYSQITLTPLLGPLLDEVAGMGEAAAIGAASLVVLVVLTSLQVIFGELVPKSVALQFPTQLALYTSMPMRWSLWLFTWFIAVLNGSGILILRLLGAGQSSHRHIHSPEEIDLMIAESRDGGLLERDEQERLHRALELSLRPVRRLMVPRNQVEAIDASDPIEEIVQQAISSEYTRLPVYEGSPENVIGLLHTRDLALRYAANGSIDSIASVLRPVVTIPESVGADRLLTLLRDEHSEQAIVIDEFGGIAGLVTIEDALAEVLGEPAEVLVASDRLERLPDGRVRLPGSLHLDEVVQWLGVRWEGEAATVSGHVTEAFGHLPEPGEQITIDDVLVEVETVDRLVIESLLATPPVPLVAGDEEPDHAAATSGPTGFPVEGDGGR